MVVAIIAGVVNAIAPKESAGGKYVNFACALVIIVVISAPFVRLLDINLPDDIAAMLNFDENERKQWHSGLLIDYSERYLATNTAGLLAQNFNFSPDDVTLHFTIEEENEQFVINHVRIDLHTMRAVLRTDEIRSFLSDTFAAPVEIVEHFR